MALTKVRGSGIDADGQEIILDADTDTTITADTDDQVDIKVGGSDIVHVTSTGLGVGTNAPTMPLDVICADNKNIVSRESTPNITNGFEIVSNDSSNQAQFVSNSATGEVNIGAINTNYFLTFSTNGTNERGRFDSAGRFLVSCTSEPNNTTSGVQLSDPGDFSSSKFSAGATADARTAIQFLNGNGSVGTIQMSGTSTSYNTSSDYRLKENVVTDWDATTRLKQLKPSRFNFKTDKDTTLDGFLAHEVSSVVPEAVTGKKDEVDSDGEMIPQGIDQSKLVPLLVKTIQELEARIATLESK